MRLTIELDSEKCGMSTILRFVRLIEEIGFRPTDNSAVRQDGFVHGINCKKEPHKPEGGYLHGEHDDTPYDGDGAMYCGRCHCAL